MEICDKCNTRVFQGSCNCTPTLTLETLRDLVSDGRYIATYGIGRIESYSINSDCLSGYDSSGYYRYTPLEDLDLTQLVSISKVTEVYRK